MCGEINTALVKFCGRCGNALTYEAAESAQSRVDTAGDIVNRFLSQKGIKEAFRRMVRDEIEKTRDAVPL